MANHLAGALLLDPVARPRAGTSVLQSRGCAAWTSRSATESASCPADSELRPRSPSRSANARSYSCWTSPWRAWIAGTARVPAGTDRRRGRGRDKRPALVAPGFGPRVGLRLSHDHHGRPVQVAGDIETLLSSHRLLVGPPGDLVALRSARRDRGQDRQQRLKALPLARRPSIVMGRPRRLP
jgi:hypothetical protein